VAAGKQDSGNLPLRKRRLSLADMQYTSLRSKKSSWVKERTLEEQILSIWQERLFYASSRSMLALPPPNKKALPRRIAASGSKKKRWMGSSNNAEVLQS
jgi:hypothetical protein